MVQVVSQDTGWDDAFRSAGKGFGQGYMNRSDETAVRSAIEKLGDNPSAQDVVKALTGARTYGNEAKQDFMKNYLGAAQFDQLKSNAAEQAAIARARNTIQEKQLAQKATERADRIEETEKKALSKTETEENKKKLERQTADALIDQLDIPDDQKQGLKGILSQKAAEDLLKEQLKPKGPSTFIRTIEAGSGDDYLNLVKDIPLLQNQSDNIDYALRLSNEVGVGSAIAHKAGFSEKAEKLESLGLTLIQPIVKIFNPSGPIAQGKLELIKDKFAIKADETTYTRKGKLEALRIFSQQALKRAKDRLELIRKYEGRPPPNDLKMFDEESETLIDVMLDYDLHGEEAKLDADAKALKGEIIIAPDGKEYYSDGLRWVKK